MSTHQTDPSALPEAPGPAPLVVAGVLLTIAVAGPLMVWTYAKEDPELGGIPFFFWFQFLQILISVALTSTSYVLVLGHERRRRAAEGLGVAS